MIDNAIIINSSYCESLKNVVRNNDSTSDDLKKAIIELGEELAKKIIEKFYLTNREIITPMERSINGLYFNYPRTVILTTKDDMNSLGIGLERKIKNSLRGYMDFEGRRGLQALTAPIRSLELPDSQNTPVVNLIIGKAVLATGCTAISLTKTAIRKYMPHNIIIVSIFYSEQGVIEIFEELPNINLFLVGKPDFLNQNGMLEPGIGNLDKRIHA